MKKQVCVKIERYYDIEATTQKEFEKKCDLVQSGSEICL